MVRLLVASVILVVIVVAWTSLVGAVSMWWVIRHPPVVAPGVDTYFIASTWVYRLAVAVPLVLFSAWYWRRVVGGGSNS